MLRHCPATSCPSLRKSPVTITTHLPLRFLCRGLGQRPPMPLERPRQSFLKAHLRLIAKKFPRLRNIRLLIADVSIARRVVLRLKRLARDSSKLAEYIIERNASPHPDIENCSWNIMSFARHQMRLAAPVQVGKIART